MRLLSGFIRWMGTLGGFGTLAVMIVVIVDVGGRALFDQPLPGGNEFAELLLVALIFLGLAAAQQRRQHYRVEVLTNHLSPGLRRVLSAIGLLASLLVVGLLAWLSLRHAWQATLKGEASYGIISFPIWPARLVVAIGLALLAMQLLIDFCRTLFSAQPADEAPSDEAPSDEAPSDEAPSEEALAGGQEWVE